MTASTQCPECSHDFTPEGFTPDDDIPEIKDNAGLKSALQKERESRRDFEKKAKTANDIVNDLQEKAGADSLDALRDFVKGGTTSKTEIDDLKAAHAKEMETLTTENTSLKTAAETGKISAALTKAQANVTVMTPHIREKLRADPTADLDDIVAEMKNDPVFAGSFKAAEQSGSGMTPGHSGDGPSGSRNDGESQLPTRRSEFSDVQKVEYINQHGVDGFMSLPD